MDSRWRESPICNVFQLIRHQKERWCLVCSGLVVVGETGVVEWTRYAAESPIRFFCWRYPEKV